MLSIVDPVRLIIGGDTSGIDDAIANFERHADASDDDGGSGAVDS